MKSFFLFIIRSFFASATIVITWLMLFFAFNFTFFQSFIYGILLGIFVYWGLKWNEKRIILKKNGLTRREYAYIQRNLKEAKVKLNRLRKVLLKTRSIQTWKVLLDINRLANRIYQTVYHEPKRFYQAENFFFYHLDSCVELSETYTRLSSQPIKDLQLRKSLEESKDMLEELCTSLENDLKMVLSNEMEHLQFELEFAKKSRGDK